MQYVGGISRTHARATLHYILLTHPPNPAIFLLPPPYPFPPHRDALHELALKFSGDVKVAKKVIKDCVKIAVKLGLLYRYFAPRSRCLFCDPERLSVVVVRVSHHFKDSIARWRRLWGVHLLVLLVLSGPARSLFAGTTNSTRRSLLWEPSSEKSSRRRRVNPLLNFSMPS
jgi:hypothetical protein